jgi:PIN domain nuclease of toxin-antitoxin system
VRFLLDTHIALWTVGEPHRVPPAAQAVIFDDSHDVFFSAATIWEIAIKASLRKPNFTARPATVRAQLLANHFDELAITSEHALAVEHLPWLHKDPFDRVLIAQAVVEGLTLITGDRHFASYPAPIRLV